MSSNEVSFSGKHINYLDALRVVCSFFVIVNHTYQCVPLLQSSNPVRFITFTSLFLSKVAVPVFLMISGFTLLSKDESLFKTLQRVLHIVVTLIIFSFIYEIYNCLFVTAQPINLKHFLHSIYDQPITNAYWYLYAYAGLLLMLPPLRKMVKTMSCNDFLYYFSLSFFFVGFWPLVVEYTSMSEYCWKFQLPLFTAHICYLLLGYYLRTYGTKLLPAPLLLTILCTTILSCAFLTQYKFVITEGTQHLFLDDISLLPITISSVCFFCLVSKIPLQGHTSAVIRNLGSYTFGIYLLGDLAIAICFPCLHFLLEYVPPILAVFGYQILSWLFALAFSIVLKHLPIFRKLI